MLDWIFEGVINWISSIVSQMMDAVSGLFLQALGTDMTAMEEYFPFVAKAFTVMQYMGWAILFLITVWQLFRVFGGPITEAENPWVLLARSALFALLIGYAKPIFSIVLDIARAPYTALMELSMTAEDFTFAGVEQVMLDLGVLLSSKIEATTIAGKKVFNVEENYLIACFDDNVTEEVITEIAKQKPYYFVMRDSSMAKVIRLINEQKATMIVEHISYDTIEGEYDSTIFTAEKNTQSFDKAFLAKKAIQDYVFTDGSAEKSIERKFAEDLDAAEEVCVYAKLPRTFQIPTPVGNYSPDWAIAFYEGKVKHIFFVAETKGTMESLELRPIEQAKISCAKKLFNEMSTSKVKYHDVDSYQSLLNIINSL